MKNLFAITLTAFIFLSAQFSLSAQCSSAKTTSVEQTGEAKFASLSMDPDIVDLAIKTDFLSTLVAAVKAGDLVGVLKGEGPYTVFAPTNDAFAALPKGTLESLLKPENKDQLVSILTYHVVPGVVKSTDLRDGMMAATAQGGKIKVGIKDGKVMINDANVTAADIMASNGVVHVIDKVILPPSK